MIADLQSERMDEQRAQLPGLANRRQPATAAAAAASSTHHVSHNSSEQQQQSSNNHALVHKFKSTASPFVPKRVPKTSKMTAPDDDAFLDFLIRCQVMKRRCLILFNIRLCVQ